MSDDKNLFANQHIIKILEEAISQSDLVLDSMPGIFAVVDFNSKDNFKGRILRSNYTLSKILGVENEHALGQKLSQLFDESNWNIFKKKALDLLNSKRSKEVFTLKMIDRDGKELSYYWQLVKFYGASESASQLLTVAGEDYTSLEEVTLTKARMQMELNSARTIQATLFPPPLAKFGSARLSGTYEPATECGGDWWYYHIRPPLVYVFIGDVTGHGLDSALLTSAIRATVSVVLDTTADLSPAHFMGVLNRSALDTLKGAKHMTFAIGCLDIHTGIFRYCLAGHEPILLLRAKSSKYFKEDIVPLLDKPSRPLGAEIDNEYFESCVQLNAGDRLVFYSDGIYDMEEIGDGKFHKVLMEAASDNHAMEWDFVNIVCREMKKLRGDRDLLDDITLVSLKMDSNYAPSPPLELIWNRDIGSGAKPTK